MASPSLYQETSKKFAISFYNTLVIVYKSHLVMAHLLVASIIFLSFVSFFCHLSINVVMPNCDQITSNAVATLLSGAFHDVCNVQVLVVAKRCSPYGGKKSNIIISDGIDQLDCSVAPQMFHLFKSRAIDHYSIVSIQHALLSEVSGYTKVVIVNMLPVSKQSVVIGTPLRGDPGSQWNSVLIHLFLMILYPPKKNCASDERNRFRELNEGSESKTIWMLMM
jgi:hypothetical protein